MTASSARIMRVPIKANAPNDDPFASPSTYTKTMYDSATWNMYNRITIARSRRAAALARLIEKELQGMGNSPHEPELSDESSDPASCYRELALLGLENYLPRQKSNRMPTLLGHEKTFTDLDPDEIDDSNHVEVFALDL
eukprot:CAMPEP_0183290806 /NCGR_PEP_ID=MMETSP0160_2-20130417/395_1 /TAXON_ID=2839 ORGANISM="Odontella Sinensis, Strain Grunow 1884" /NCGR_SAMPLE_ID=MMETSP0160_2 /ASSEMBLY_ACC=CAM_ASM_000250 /LENGTH=138 /DNA_ID=CAMNT_0025451471 /DNA_START=140 /DNA_END=556 /DNA_ORIENTATION=+